MRRSTLGLAGLFLVSGVTHVVRPGVFTPLVPRRLPSPTGIVYASGVAELACAAGLLRGTPWAGPASAWLLVGILPGNVQMAVSATAAARRRRTPARVAYAAACWARVPLQAPLIRTALSTRP